MRANIEKRNKLSTRLLIACIAVISILLNAIAWYVLTKSRMLGKETLALGIFVGFFIRLYFSLHLSAIP